MKFKILYISLALIIACDRPSTRYQHYSDVHEWEYENGSNDESDDYQYDESVIYDGYYCAQVTYYNPNTGRESQYTLTVEVSDNELERINFPQGWLDNDDFGYEDFDEDGYLSFTSDSGYDYTVQIIEEDDDCLDYVPTAYQCIGITSIGDQCERLTDNPSGYCWQHKDQE